LPENAPEPRKEAGYKSSAHRLWLNPCPRLELERKSFGETTMSVVDSSPTSGSLYRTSLPMW
jgi:hypothetical protein